MSSELAQKKCQACQGNEDPLKGDELQDLQQQLDSGWKLVEEHHLEKVFSFDNFRQTLDFVNRVGEVAEQEDHHPDIYLTYGKAKIQIWTHKIDGLTESDFIFAAKTDEVL